MTENWRPAPGFPAYEVSNLGNVRSIPRIVERVNRESRCAQHLKGRPIKTYGTGYAIECDPTATKYALFWKGNLLAEGFNLHRLKIDVCAHMNDLTTMGYTP